MASPTGGQPSLDSKSNEPDFQTDDTRQFDNDDVAKNQLANTVKLKKVKAEDFDAVFYPEGHGPLWDLHNDKGSITLIEDFISAGKPVAAVCHAPAVLLQVKGKNGVPVLKGKRVTGFSNTEEAAVGLTNVVPYLQEDKLIELGGLYQKKEDWN